MAGLDEEHFSSVPVITLDPNVINSIIRLSCIVLTHFDGCRIPDKQAFFQIAEFLSESGFVVLRYDKKGVNSNFTLSDGNVWGNVTFDDLKKDAEMALSLLLQQPEVNTSKKATLIGHSEGTMIAPELLLITPIK